MRYGFFNKGERTFVMNYSQYEIRKMLRHFESTRPRKIRSFAFLTFTVIKNVRVLLTKLISMHQTQLHVRVTKFLFLPESRTILVKTI